MAPFHLGPLLKWLGGGMVIVVLRFISPLWWEMGLRLNFGMITGVEKCPWRRLTRSCFPLLVIRKLPWLIPCLFEITCFIGMCHSQGVCRIGSWSPSHLSWIWFILFSCRDRGGSALLGAFSKEGFLRQVLLWMFEFTFF